MENRWAQMDDIMKDKNRNWMKDKNLSVTVLLMAFIIQFCIGLCYLVFGFTTKYKNPAHSVSILYYSPVFKFLRFGIYNLFLFFYI